MPGMRPSTVSASLWQTPQAWTRMRISSGPGTGISALYRLEAVRRPSERPSRASWPSCFPFENGFAPSLDGLDEFDQDDERMRNSMHQELRYLLNQSSVRRQASVRRRWDEIMSGARRLMLWNGV